MMKILQIGKYYAPYHGGMETVLRDLCVGLSNDLNHNVTVLCANHDNLSIFRDDLNTPRILRLKTIATLFSQPIMPTFPATLFKLIRNTDIIHLHTPNPFAEFFVYIFSAGKPIVITHHSDVVRQKLLAPIHAFFAKRLYKKAKAIIVPTKNHIKTSRILCDLKTRIEIIPFGLNLEKLIAPHDVNPAALERAKSHGDYILFVGRLVGYKGLDVLIKAMQQTPAHLKLLIVGNGEEKENLKRLVSDLNLQQRIHFLGRVDDMHDFAALYKESIALVLPSISSNENFGMVQLEAMYYSRPIITTNLLSGVPVVAEPNISSLLVEPKNEVELAQAITSLANDRARADKMGQEARKLFEKKYQLTDAVIKHQQLFEQVI